MTLPSPYMYFPCTDQPCSVVLIAMHHLLQTSEAELLEGLQQLGALEWDGRWMLVDPECVSTLMELLQLTLTECGWHWSSTPQQELEGKMQEAGYDPRCASPAHVRKVAQAASSTSHLKCIAC